MGSQLRGQTEAEAVHQRPAKDKNDGKPKVSAALNQSNARKHSFRVPEKLIGTKSTGQVTILGKQFGCLLDTGLQVTTVTKSFYDKYLPDQQIEPLYNLLEVEGANGQPVPYLGYVEVTITFPEQFLGAKYEVPTLALVVPDSGTSGYQILVGTNTLDVGYSMCREKSPASYHPALNGYSTVLKVLQLRQGQSVDSNIGLVRMQGRRQETHSSWRNGCS